MLSCLKFNNTGMVAFIGLSTGIVQLGIGIAIVFIMTTLPIIYAYVVYKNRKELSKEETKSKFSSLYLGIKLDKTNRTTWLYPFLWMLRRSIFMAITIGLFQYPNL